MFWHYFVLTGNPVDKVVLINFYEDIALNISAEEYENLSPDSADNEVAGVDNEVAGADNEEAGALRPKTPTGAWIKVKHLEIHDFTSQWYQVKISNGVLHVMICNAM